MKYYLVVILVISCSIHFKGFKDYQGKTNKFVFFNMNDSIVVIKHISVDSNYEHLTYLYNIYTKENEILSTKNHFIEHISNDGSRKIVNSLYDSKNYTLIINNNEDTSYIRHLGVKFNLNFNKTNDKVYYTSGFTNSKPLVLNNGYKDFLCIYDIKKDTAYKSNYSFDRILSFAYSNENQKMFLSGYNYSDNSIKMSIIEIEENSVEKWKDISPNNYKELLIKLKPEKFKNSDVESFMENWSTEIYNNKTKYLPNGDILLVLQTYVYDGIYILKANCVLEKLYSANDVSIRDCKNFIEDVIPFNNSNKLLMIQRTGKYNKANLITFNLSNKRVEDVVELPY
jgi:hypothetical protein